MYILDILQDKRKFLIEASSRGLNTSEAIYDDEYVGIPDLPRIELASARMSFKVLKSLDVNQYKKGILEFIKDNKFKKYFLNSNFLSKKQLLQILFDLKSEVKFHFDADVTTYVLSKQGFFKGKVCLLSLIRFKDQVYLCELLNCDNVSRLEMFDYKKPYRRQRQGMMPPKLTSFMLNLLAAPKCVLDPFCGTGTTLMLANLKGIKFKGSDIDETNVDGTLTNLSYIQKKLDLDDLNQGVFSRDAVKLSSSDLQGVDSICTEGFLGKPKSGKEPKAELITESNKLANFYLDFFRNLYEVSEDKLEVVMTLPVYIANKDLIFMYRFFDNVLDVGFRVVNLHPDFDDYLYSRKDQRVYRQVIKLLKV